jgi:G3E family GTPase
VYFRRKPFDRIKLDKFAEDWPQTIIRSKGLIWLSDDNMSAFILEQAGRQITVGFTGDWMATGTKAQIKATMEADPDFKANWDEKVGDRMIKMVFIGKDMDQEKIIAQLDACLVEPQL